MLADTLRPHLEQFWEGEAIPVLEQYTRLECRSPAFDTAWEATGSLDEAAELLRVWCASRQIPGATVEIVRLEGRTPTILMIVPPTGSVDDTVVLYGHFDKQPPFTGWRDGLDPYNAVRMGDRIYGRGIADDGYSTFASVGAIEAVRANGGQHSRIVVLIEGSEESGSPDLPTYLTHLRDRIGEPSVMIALDSGCLSYDRLWVTTSLRGLVGGTLRVDVLQHGVHSGLAGGVVPSSFRILRQLLSRVEDEKSGSLLPAFEIEIPANRVAQAEAVAAGFGEAIDGEFPGVPGLQLIGDTAAERILNHTWRPSLAVVGLAGAPAPGDAGNVLRPFTEAKVSVRIPPTLSADAAAAELERVLTADPPYGAKVTFSAEEKADGWNAPDIAPWLTAVLDQASADAFDQPAAYVGVGGTIPFLGTLTELYPKTQIVALGVLGPQSNAHGPDEFLHVPMVKNVTACVASVLDAHARSAAGRPSATDHRV